MLVGSLCYIAAQTVQLMAFASQWYLVVLSWLFCLPWGSLHACHTGAWQSNWKCVWPDLSSQRSKLWMCQWAVCPVLKTALLCLQVSVVGETINLSGQSACTPVKVPECRLSDDFESLLDNATFSDVTLSVGGREFQAHKALLAGRKLL